MNTFANLTVTDTTFPAAPQFSCPPGSIQGRYSLSLLWKSGVKIEYSFDGQNLHGDLEAGQPNQGLTFDDKPIPARGIWFRVQSSSVVRIEASVKA